MATDQPLLTNWATPPLMSAKMKISLVSWTVSIETDPRAGGAGFAFDVEQNIRQLSIG